MFATQDQTALTIARLLVDHVIAHHGVPAKLISDYGPAFLSKLVSEVCKVVGGKKINTTAYNPQTDGLIERTLTDMSEQAWAGLGHMPTLCALGNHMSVQRSTQEAPFLLFYGRKPRLPIQLALSLLVDREKVNVDNYKSEILRKRSETWELTRGNKYQ